MREHMPASGLDPARIAARSQRQIGQRLGDLADRAADGRLAQGPSGANAGLASVPALSDSARWVWE